MPGPTQEEESPKSSWRVSQIASCEAETAAALPMPESMPSEPCSPRLAGAGGPAGSDLLPRIGGSPVRVSSNCLSRVPQFHENLLLQDDGRDHDLANDGAALRWWRTRGQ
jgi:hypothetical protein